MVGAGRGRIEHGHGRCRAGWGCGRAGNRPRLGRALPVGTALGGRRAVARPVGGDLRGGNGGRGDRRVRLRRRLCSPEPRGARSCSAVRAQLALGPCRGERDHLRRSVGGDGTHVAAAGCRRAPPPPGGPRRGGLVRRDDPRRVGGDPARPGPVRRPRRRRVVHGAARRGGRDVSAGAINGVRADLRRVRVQSRGGAAARVVTPRSSGGAVARLGVDVGGDGQARCLWHRPSRLRPAGRRASLVGSGRARRRDGFGVVRDPPCARVVGPQTPAGLLDDRERRSDPDRRRSGRRVRSRWQPHPGCGGDGRRPVARDQPRPVQGSAVSWRWVGRVRDRDAGPRPAGTAWSGRCR